jgi:hypothetical protein
MQEHYSTVQIEEMRASIGKVVCMGPDRKKAGQRGPLTGRLP